MAIATTSLLCLALTGFREARGEPEKSQLAAMYVTENRRHALEEKLHRPVSVCEVVSKKRQYAWYRKYGLKIPENEQKDWHKSIELAKRVYYGKSKNFTRGALFFNTKKLGKRFKTPIKPLVISAMMFY